MTDLALKRWKNNPVNWQGWAVIGNSVPLSRHFVVPLDEVDAAPAAQPKFHPNIMQQCLWNYRSEVDGTNE